MNAYGWTDLDDPVKQKEAQQMADDIRKTADNEFYGDTSIWAVEHKEMCAAGKLSAHLDAHYKFVIYIALFFHHKLTPSIIKRCYDFAGAPADKAIKDVKWMHDRQTSAQHAMIAVITQMVEAVVHLTGGRMFWERNMIRECRRSIFEHYFDQSPHKICSDVFSWIGTSIGFGQIFSLPMNTPRIQFFRWFVESRLSIYARSYTSPS